VIEPAPSSRASRSRDLAPLSVLLLGVGVVFAVLYVVFNGSEHHSFNAGALAPDTVHVTAGKTYEISTPGGVKAIAKRGGDPNTVSCSYTVSNGASAPLTVAALGTGTRTTHAIATFLAPVTGRIHVDCQGLAGGTYVDNSDDAATDYSGLFILLSVFAFTGGAGFGMSALYRRSTARLREDDEVEGGVDGSYLSREDEEVLGPDGGDIGEQLR
jgi:hypothetical protein